MHIPRRRFGQHFLVDRSYIDRIVRAIAPERGDVVVEIGPGQGALTHALKQQLERLHVIEIDRDLVRQLRATFADDSVVVHEGDALDFDFGTLGGQLRIVGNLPYNISTPLLFHIARYATIVRDCCFMLQKEVVDRMVAAPATPDYGRLSVMLQYRFAMNKLFDVPPGAFAPPPKVYSAVVHMQPLDANRTLARDESLFAEVVTQAFTMRRKTLRNALSRFIAAEDMLALGIDPQVRPETLSVNQYVSLANYVCDRGGAPETSSRRGDRQYSR